MVHQKTELPRGRVHPPPCARWGPCLQIPAKGNIKGRAYGVDRPIRYEHNRFLGDKRRQVVYDLDALEDRSVLDELVASEQVATFGPDTLAEARNRGYRLRLA